VILVDTSIWIDHLRRTDEQLSALLGDRNVLGHPFVTGELALGNLLHRDTVIGALQELPQARVATDSEVLRLISANSLFARGIGYTDTHLLAAVLLTPGSALWTRDKRLLAVALEMGVARNAAH